MIYRKELIEGHRERNIFFSDIQVTIRGEDARRFTKLRDGSDGGIFTKGRCWWEVRESRAQKERKAGRQEETIKGPPQKQQETTSPNPESIGVVGECSAQCGRRGSGDPRKKLPGEANRSETSTLVNRN